MLDQATKKEKEGTKLKKMEMNITEKHSEINSSFLNYLESVSPNSNRTFRGIQTMDGRTNGVTRSQTKPLERGSPRTVQEFLTGSAIFF